MCGASGRLTVINNVIIFGHSGFSENAVRKCHAEKQDSDHEQKLEYVQ